MLAHLPIARSRAGLGRVIIQTHDPNDAATRSATTKATTLSLVIFIAGIQVHPRGQLENSLGNVFAVRLFNSTSDLALVDLQSLTGFHIAVLIFDVPRLLR